MFEGGGCTPQYIHLKDITEGIIPLNCPLSYIFINMCVKRSFNTSTVRNTSMVHRCIMPIHVRKYLITICPRRSGIIIYAYAGKKKKKATLQPNHETNTDCTTLMCECTEMRCVLVVLFTSSICMVSRHE